MGYEIGQTLAHEAPRGITGDRLERPEWYALTVRREQFTRAHLRQSGVHACYPERVKTWISRGRRHRRHYPIVSGIIYAKFRAEPQWDVLKARKLITGVFCSGDKPIVIPGDIISAVMGLPMQVERLEAAKEELLRIRAGDRAELTEGPLSGVIVNVDQVREGRLWFATLTGVKGEAPIDNARRLT